MSRRSLLVPLILMTVAAVVALVAPLASNTKPVLGLDLQGGFSMVLQAKEVNGRLPTEEAVEKAKDIIRQRVDGLGVAEPDITRQGRTVIVQLPGVRNREKAESLVGCTARLEFRPVLNVGANPAAPSASTTEPGQTTTTAAGSTTVPGSSTTVDATETTTTAPGSTTTSGSGDDETGMAETGTGTVGISPGEGALPVQFVPTTTTTTAPTTTTTEPPATTSTTVAPDSTTSTSTVTDGTTTTTAPGSATTSSSCGSASDSGAAPTTPSTTIPGTPSGGGQFPSDDGAMLYTLGPVGFTGDALSSAQARLGQTEGWVVNVNVRGSQEAKANSAFNACYQAAATCPPVGSERGAIAIVLDGKVLSSPQVNGPDLASGADGFTISGDFKQSEAKDLALVLRYGSLPVEFEQAALQQVSATLGHDSLEAGLIAGLVGVAALAIYMILYYRGFGIVVVVSLVVWSALMYGVVCLLSATQGLALTLAGITGIIVSIGTTVDTYVVVFERVKDEVRAGRTIRRATEVGYESGIKTVFTANGAAFLGAFLLWYLTVGPVRGFAYFLGISVLLDLGVAVLFTRPLMMLLSRSERFAQARFFGVGASTDQVTLAKGAAS